MNRPLRFLIVTAVVGISAFVAASPTVKAGAALVKGEPHRVRAVKNIPYHEGKDADPVKQKLDLFVPEDASGFPVLFFVHGGAWTIGDRTWFDSIGPVFARNGIGTVVISYRLSPKVRHPAHVEDVARAFAWTHKNIAKYGGRPDRIFVSGQSAGGHLTALLGTNGKYLKPYGLAPKDIRGAAPISGIYRVGPGFMGKTFGTDVATTEDASPIRRITGEEPPFLILYADRDMPGCALMSNRFGDALRAKRVPADVVEIKDRDHISIMVKLMLNDEDATAQELLRFIAKHSDLKLTPVGPTTASAKTP